MPQLIALFDHELLLVKCYVPQKTKKRENIYIYIYI